MDVFLQVSDDGGKTFAQRSASATSTSTTTSSGSIRTTPTTCSSAATAASTRASTAAPTWRLQANLPVTQFYDVDVDNAAPFYNVYGGTQDNFTLGGPSRTRTAARHHQPRLVRDRGRRRLRDPASTRRTRTSSTPSRSTAARALRPADRRDRRTSSRSRAGRAGAALELGLAAHHQPALAHPALLRRQPAVPQRRPRQHLARRSARPDAPDRSQHAAGHGPGLGRRRGGAAPRRSLYGNIVGARRVAQERRPALRRHRRRPDPGERGRRRQLAEERALPRRAGQHLRSGAWSASRHDADTVYAAFDNHKNGDFKPYVFKSTDRGRTWTSIAGDLPARGTVYVVIEDHVDPAPALRRHRVRALLHPGRRRASGSRLKGGLPTIAGARPGDPGARERPRARHLRPRHLRPRRLHAAAPGRGARRWRRTSVLLPGQAGAGSTSRPCRSACRGKSLPGRSYYTAPNPPFGAVFTYYLKEGYKSRQQAA